MKHRLGRGATIAAGAVAASLFLMLCMAFYGKEDYLSPERILARGDALRFRIASMFVEPFGAGAFLGCGLLFVWSVVAYFREGVGPVMPRLVGVAACIPSFCAITSLASSSGPHEFWAGSVGVWMGDVVYRGFGPALAWSVVGTLFLVSFAMATELGFYGHLATLRGSLSFPLLPPEEPAREEASSAVAVLDAPGTETADAAPWKLPEPWVVPAPDPVEEAAPAEDADSFSDAVVLDRESHLADIRRRMAAGEPVTETERALAAEATDSAAMAEAVDALFDDPVIYAEPPAPEAEAPAAVVTVPDLPPFLLPDPSPPLLSQELALEAPTFPPAGPAPEAIPAPAEAPAPTATERAEAGETDDFGEPAPSVISSRAPYIFAGVEFLPPNEELADPDAPAPTPAPSEEPSPELAALFAEPAESIVEPAAETAPAPLPLPEPEIAAPVSAPEPVAPPPAAVSPTFEDEFFSFGLDGESGAAADAAPAAIESAAPEAPAVPASVAAAPVDVNAPGRTPTGSPTIPGVPPAQEEPPVSWLDAAAAVLADLSVAEEAPAPVLETAPTAVESAPSDSAAETAPTVPGVPVAETAAEDPAAPPADEVLAKLFGEPVIRPTLAPAPSGPPQSEPREPPANLSPVIEEVAERVTLLTDPPVTDCLTDHGIELDIHQEAVVPPSQVVDDGTPAGGADPAVAPALSVEDAADAIVASLHDLWGELLSEPEAAAAPAADAEAPEVHGWGTMFPFMMEEAVAADPDDAEAGVLIAQMEEVEDHAPAHGPPPGQAPLEPGDIRAEAPVDAAPPAVAPAVVPVPEVAPPLLPILEEPVEEGEPEEEEARKVDEALVSRLVEGFREEESPAAAEPAASAVPAPAMEPAPAEKTSGKDDLYDQAVQAVRERGRGSVVVLQRKLGIGFTRATTLLERLVADGILGPENASGSHPIL